MNPGEQLKKEGQEAVWKNEDEEWRKLALDILHDFSTKNFRFTADDFRNYAQELGLPSPHHPNVWGSLYTAAAAKFWIRKSGDYDASKNAASHAHTYAVWESLLCPPPGPTKSMPGVRYELRAPDKCGVTVATEKLARSQEMMESYCDYVGVKSHQVTIKPLYERAVG